MNKNVLVGVIIAIIVVILVIGGYFIFSNKSETSKNLDLAAISDNITNTRFSEMAMMEVDKDTLSSYYQVDVANVEEVYGKVPMMNVQASMYVLIKAVDGKAEDVKQNLETFGQSYEEQWSTYLPAQHELVQNRKIGTIGNYVYLVIAENVDELVQLIK